MKVLPVQAAPGTFLGSRCLDCHCLHLQLKQQQLPEVRCGDVGPPEASRWLLLTSEASVWLVYLLQELFQLNEELHKRSAIPKLCTGRWTTGAGTTVPGRSGRRAR